MAANRKRRPDPILRDGRLLEAELKAATSAIEKAREALEAIRVASGLGVRVTRHSRDMALAVGKAETALRKAKRLAAKVTRHSRDLAIGAKVTRHSRDLKD